MRKELTCHDAIKENQINTWKQLNFGTEIPPACYDILIFYINK